MALFRTPPTLLPNLMVEVCLVLAPDVNFLLNSHKQGLPCWRSLFFFSQGLGLEQGAGGAACHPPDPPFLFSWWRKLTNITNITYRSFKERHCYSTRCYTWSECQIETKNHRCPPLEYIEK